MFFLTLALMALGGVLLALAYPNPLLPGAAGDRPWSGLAWIALLPLLWAVQALPGRRAAWAVGVFSLCWYLVTLTWLTLFGEGALGLLLWALLTLYLACTPLLALLCARRITVHPLWLPLAFAAAFTGIEWLRGQGIFGLAWSELGMSQVEWPTVRLAALGGVPLVTFCLLWVMGSMVAGLRERRAASYWLLPLLVTMACIFAGSLVTWGATIRWMRQPSGQEITVVQPNSLVGLSPRDLQDPANEAEQRACVARDHQRLLDLLKWSVPERGKGSPTPRLTIWPESALPFVPYVPEISELTRRTDSYLLVGAPSVDYQTRRICNSAYLFQPGWFSNMERYDKIHLVPFGEFVPFRKFVEQHYRVRDEDLQPGKSWTPLHATGHLLGVGICFESTDTGIARRYADAGAKLLIYISNDAWFHQTPAVRQHFNQSRLRAIETGLPVARSAATGISGFIAPDGSILDEIPTYTAGHRTRYLPDGVPGTPYTRGGWLFGPLCLLATGVGVLVRMVVGFWRKKFPQS